MFCTACATPNPRRSLRCDVCGTELGTAGASLPLTSPGPAAGERRRVRHGLYVVALLALVLALAGVSRAGWGGAARWYAQGEVAAAAGRYPAAIAAFAAAGDHIDAPARRAALDAAFAPHAAAYEAAVEARANGDTAGAIALLRPVVRALPRYEEAALLLSEARDLRAAELARETDAAEIRRDWLAAERSLAALVALVPADPAPAARLAALRREHAPLVLARDRALWLAGPDGTDDRLLYEERPVAWPTWSPDRSRIAFTSSEIGGGIALFVFDLGSGEARLVADDLRAYAGPAWSPDGTRIAYAATAGSALTWGGEGGVRVVDVASGRVTDVTAGRVVDALYPSWSPDGERLAFVSREAETGGYSVSPTADPAAAAGGALSPAGELYVATLATGEIENLSRSRVPHPWRAAWSPVGETVLVYTREPGMSYDRDRARVALLDATSGRLADLATGGERLTMPVWSPDGRRLAYAAGEDVLVVRDLDGGARRFGLDAPISRFVSWSPDGRTILAAADPLGGDSFVVPLEAEPGPGGDAFRPEPTPLRLAYDADRRQSGAPQWAPIYAPPTAAAPAVGGTSLDHDGQPERSGQ